MKKIITSIYLTIVICCFFTNNLKAQFLNYAPGSISPNSHTQPDYTGTYLPIESTGIGDFNTAATVPLAPLNINSFYLPTPVGYAPGELFRTDASNAQNNWWRMFVGPSAGAVTEKFSVQSYVPGGSYNGNEVSLRCPDGEDEFYFQQAQVSMIFRHKTLGFLSENFGAFPDEVSFGDGTDVSTNLRALASSGYPRGMHLQGSNGNFRFGEFAIPNILENHIQMDVIGHGIDQTLAPDPLHMYDVVFQGRVSDDTTSFIRLMNGTNQNNMFVPTLHGHQNESAGPHYFQGLAVLGSINPGDDAVVGGSSPVMDFGVRTYVPGNTTGTNLQTVIASRDLFRWRNFTTLEMLMNAKGQLGVATGTPNNRVEINAQTTDPYNASTSGQSGLRLTKMLAGATTMANPGSGVLSVDNHGDVIYVPGGGAALANNGLSNSGGFAQLGGPCASATAAALANSREIPMSGFNILLSGQSSTPAASSNINSLGIGNTCPGMIGRLTVSERAGVLVTTPTTAGVYSENSDAFAASVSVGTEMGVYGGASGVNHSLKFYNYGGNFLAQNGSVDYGVYGKADGTNSAVGFGWGGYFAADNHFGTAIGVEARATNTTGTANNNAFGVNAYAENGTVFNYGVTSKALSGPTNTTNAGVISLGQTNNSTFHNYGGNFAAVRTNTGTGQNIGVYATGVLNPGLGGSLSYISGTDYAGYFDGHFYLNGDFMGSGANLYTSDSVFKTNVDSITNALSIIKLLKPKKYYMDTLNTHGMNFPSKKQYGLIAQQVATVLPELVYTVTKPADYNSAGTLLHAAYTYKALNYNAFAAILMRGIQEQQRTIDSLKTKNSKQDSINSYVKEQISTLTAIIDSCCSRRSAQPMNNNNNNNTTGNNYNNSGSGSKINSSSTDVKLTDGQSIVLDQNVPNPFAEETTINYFLPDDIGKAQMLFYNAGGKLIQSIELTQKGQGQLNVFAQDLTNGMYSYTLVVDGKVFETKKMVKQ